MTTEQEARVQALKYLRELETMEREVSKQAKALKEEILRLRRHLGLPRWSSQNGSLSISDRQERSSTTATPSNNSQDR